LFPLPYWAAFPPSSTSPFFLQTLPPVPPPALGEMFFKLSFLVFPSPLILLHSRCTKCQCASQLQSLRCVFSTLPFPSSCQNLKPRSFFEDCSLSVSFSLLRPSHSPATLSPSHKLSFLGTPFWMSFGSQDLPTMRILWAVFFPSQETTLKISGVPVLHFALGKSSKTTIVFVPRTGSLSYAFGLVSSCSSFFSAFLRHGFVVSFQNLSALFFSPPY